MKPFRRLNYAVKCTGARSPATPYLRIQVAIGLLVFGFKYTVNHGLSVIVTYRIWNASRYSLHFPVNPRTGEVRPGGTLRNHLGMDTIGYGVLDCFH